MRIAPSTPTSDGAPSPDPRRARFRAAAARVAFGAGLVGLVARALGPRLRAYVARRRDERRGARGA